MKRAANILTICFLLILLASSTEAGNFVSGSTGADGAFSPTSDTTLQLPSNGIFNFTTVNIPVGVTVKFQRNTANTPVYILTAGDVNIGGTIDVSGENGTPGNTGIVGGVPGGKGGPGGFDGGWGGEPPSTGIAAKAPGNGLGPGGGKAGDYNCDLRFSGTDYFPGLGGGFGTKGEGYSCAWSGGASISGGNSYGSPTLLPLMGGSGGGGALAENSLNSYGAGGGGGGGAILIGSSGSINITGTIKANGGNGGSSRYGSGGGSGGAIRLVSNRISSSDNGSVQATSGVGLSLLYQYQGYSQWYYYSNGGSGRIRLEGYIITLTNVSPSPSISTPGLVFLPQIPSLLITKIAGNTVPSSASGSYTTPDITLPSTIMNPISIEITAANIPVGTTVKINAVPQHGDTASTTTTLTGTDTSSTATASLNISTTEPSIINAETTFTIQTAMFYDGEKIDKVRVASKMGKGSEVTYITESGKEIPAEKLFAKVVR